MLESVFSRIVAGLVLTVIVTMLTIGGILAWLTVQNDKEAELTSKRMMSAGLQQNLESLKRQLNDYTFWSDATVAVEQNDLEWLNYNIASYTTESKNVTGIAIISPNGDIKHRWQINAFGGKSVDFFPKELVEVAVDSLEGFVARTEDTQAFYWRMNGRVVGFAVQRLSDNYDTDAGVSAKRDLLVFALELDPFDVLRLGSLFLFNDVALNVSGSDKTIDTTRISQPITDIEGRVIADLNWKPQRPARTLLIAAAWPILLLVILLVLSAALIAVRSGQLARQLSDEKDAATIAARTDAMTGLMNRAGIAEILGAPALISHARDGKFAVIYIDINNFKTINDTMGHAVGDALICAVAGKLRENVPYGSLVVRLGGDEFAIALIGDLASQTPILAANLATTLKTSYEIDGLKIVSTCAVGYAPGELGLEPEAIVRRADLAMYYAKASKMHGARAFDADMENALAEEMALEADMRAGLREGRFSVHYQPISNCTTGRIDHVEALARFNDKNGKPVGPDAFIPVAERTGLIQELGMFVLDRVCEDLRKWPHMRAAVNASPVQLLNVSFVETANAILAKHGLSPDKIVFELTEGVLIEQPILARKQIDALKTAGYKMFLDDFGSGFSSIGYLSQFSFDGMKIDRSVVQKAALSEENALLLHAITALARAMQLDVIAEGIETEEHVKLMQKAGCQWMQGWHFGRPMSADQITSFMAEDGIKSLVNLSGSQNQKAKQAIRA